MVKYVLDEKPAPTKAQATVQIVAIVAVVAIAAVVVLHYTGTDPISWLKGFFQGAKL